MAVAITGIGLVTRAGQQSRLRCLNRIISGEKGVKSSNFSTGGACPWIAPVSDFDAEKYFPENKTLRLMSRDAQMAVVAARLAMQDAGVVPDELYPAEEIALYGATGLSGMPTGEIARLVRDAAAADGSLDLENFGRVALKRTRPVLSFKILANMPICFVSIFENLRGPNAVYTPWEGNGAQAIIAGIEAIESGEVPCAVVGGCDVKTHVLSMVELTSVGHIKILATTRRRQYSRRRSGVLGIGKSPEMHTAREAKIYGLYSRLCLWYRLQQTLPLADTFSAVLDKLDINMPE